MRKKSYRWCWLVMLLWLGSALSTLAWLQQRQQGVFDPERQLQQLPLNWADWRLMAGKVPTSLGTAAGTEKILLLVTDDACACQQTTKAQLTTLVQQTDFQLLEISSAEVLRAGISIPAVPLLLIFAGQQLRYAGPVAAGQFCGASDNLLLPLLQQPQLLPSVWFNSESSSCRCVVQQA